MIAVFLGLAFLRTLHGAPILTPISLDAAVLVSRDIFPGQSDGANTRSTHDLLKSCALTVLACVWTAAHPNIPGPRDSTWTCMKRRIVMMICALVAPEAMALWALRQWNAAGIIADDYNTTVLGLPKQEQNSLWRQGLWEGLKDILHELFIELPKDRARRGKGQTWSTTHGYFIQMGGFLLYENEYPKRVLDYNDMKRLIRANRIDVPIYTESDLKDRSKGDTISKAVVVLQTTWFVVQCITRLCTGLPLSELEVVTLGFAVLNGIIYAIWWNKPQDVGLAIFVPLKAPEEVGGTENSRRRPGEYTDAQKMGMVGAGVEVRLQGFLDRDGERYGEGDGSSSRYPGRSVERNSDHDEAAELFGSEGPETTTVKFVKESRPRGTPEEGRWDQHWLSFIIIAPLDYLLRLLRPLGKMMTSDDAKTSTGAHRMPMFYADRRGKGVAVLNATCAIGAVFGAVHLLAWSSAFPSRTDLLLWRISTVLIIAEPVLVLVASVISWSGRPGLDMALVYIAFVVSPLYVVARFTLVTLAFLSLHALSPLVFVVVPWTSYIPHL